MQQCSNSAQAAVGPGGHGCPASGLFLSMSFVLLVARRIALFF
jgi:hypothetical protein